MLSNGLHNCEEEKMIMHALCSQEEASQIDSPHPCGNVSEFGG